jgi:hypothetical protein
VIFFSISRDTTLFQIWRWPIAIRWSRFFHLL